MTAEPNNIDDELLSAYLDDELAPEERARVEERLAADAGARSLLEQLRTVSRAVKQLPPAPLGADLRENVLRRAERAMLVSAPPASGERARAHGNPPRRGELKSDSLPRFTIGRSVRGWVWAGLATAAALAIAAFESTSNRDDKLPESVAERSVESLGRAASDREASATIKPEQDGPSISSAPRLIMTAPAVEAPLKEGFEMDKLSVHSERELASKSGRGGAAIGRAGATFDAGKPSAPSSIASFSDNSDANLVVVRLQVKPQAFDERAFDQVLLRNGITVEESGDESRMASDANSRGKTGLLSAAREMPAPAKQAAEQVDQSAAENKPRPRIESSAATAGNIDLVLVEAPAEQIKSCLDEIGKNDRDYLGVVVEEDQVASKKENLSDNRDSRWQQYQRGVVPQQQQLQRGANNDFYFSTDEGPVVIGGGSNLNSNVGSQFGVDAQQAEQKRSLDKDLANLSDQRGRAMRMRSQVPAEANQQSRGGNSRALRLDANRALQSNANAPSRAAGSDAEESHKEKSSPPTNDTLQVLFILSAGDQGATPPASETKAAK
jgi:anti-sigma factor RsiW